MSDYAQYDLLWETRPDIANNLTGMLWRSGIPEHMHDGLVRYLRHGIVPGSFLLAILTNDYMQACAYADQENRDALANYGAFLFQLPNVCYGSTDKVTEWVQRGEARRQKLSTFTS